MDVTDEAVEKDFAGYKNTLSRSNSLSEASDTNIECIIFQNESVQPGIIRSNRRPSELHITLRNLSAAQAANLRALGSLPGGSGKASLRISLCYGDTAEVPPPLADFSGTSTKDQYCFVRPIACGEVPRGDNENSDKSNKTRLDLVRPDFEITSEGEQTLLLKTLLAKPRVLSLTPTVFESLTLVLTQIGRWCLQAGLSVRNDEQIKSPFT